MQSNPNQTPLTEMPELAESLGLQKLFIKHEDQNPSGSHKDRAIWPMIDTYLEQGVKNFVISSSGNAAISAAYYCLLNKNITLDIFVSPNLPISKENRLNDLIQDQYHITVHKSKRAKSDAIKYAKENNSQLLRASVDDLALPGYEKLALELVEQLSQLSEDINEYQIFIATSSGTTLVGLTRGFIKARVNPPLNAIQTTHVNIIAKEFDGNFTPSKSSLASAIVDTIGYRQDRVVSEIKNSHGSGWVINDEELKAARTMLKSENNWDSLLTLAGLIKAKKTTEVTHAVLMFCGK